MTAEAFLSLVTASKQAGKDEAVAAKDQAKLELERRVKAMLQEHVGTPAWTALLERARAAATLGENSFELIRFPCDLCSDGGRKIDVAETDWPTTLRGEAAEFYMRWNATCARPSSDCRPNLSTTSTESRATWRCP